MTIDAEANSGHGRLGFVDLTLDAFAFLLQIGFEVARREPTRVVFQNGEVVVNVYHGRSSYQVGLEIERLDVGDRYSLHEILATVAPSEVERARCQTNDPEILKRCLGEIADVVERTCGSLLAGDARAFEDLRAAVAPRRRAGTLEAQFGAVVDRADQAWEAKAFDRATELYKEAEPALDEIRRRRLRYLTERRK